MWGLCANHGFTTNLPCTDNKSCIEKNPSTECVQGTLVFILKTHNFMAIFKMLYNSSGCWRTNRQRSIYFSICYSSYLALANNNNCKIRGAFRKEDSSTLSYFTDGVYVIYLCLFCNFSRFFSFTIDFFKFCTNM